jgi:glycine cleavage system H protein
MKDYKFDATVRYTKSHEWARMDKGEVVCGVSDTAQDLLSDVVFVDLPEVGASFNKGDVFGTVESVKAAEDVYIPVSGKVVAVNADLGDSPESVNSDPFGKAWFIRVQPTNLQAEWAELMDVETYKKHVAAEAESHG